MHSGRLVPTALLGLIVGSCSKLSNGEPHGSGDIATPPGRSVDDRSHPGPLTLPRFRDLDPDPHTIEVNLDARVGQWEYASGRRIAAYTYNGTVPGPTLEGHVGDHVVVHFVNHLDQPTTIHWHGVRVPNAMDGSEAVQHGVPAGGRFDYRFDLLDAGTFWYHPHANEPEQMAHGLFGAIVVHGADEPPIAQDTVLMLSDLRLGPDGEIAPPGGMHDVRDGREGSVLLVNGREGTTLEIRAGTRQRWRLIDVANARYFRVGLTGHRLLVIGSDRGFAADAREVDDLLLTPGDRADVIVAATGAPGSMASLQLLPYDRGGGLDTGPVVDLMHLQYTSESPAPLRPLMLRPEPIPPLPVAGVTPQLVRFEGGCCGGGGMGGEGMGNGGMGEGEGMSMGHGDMGGMQFSINGHSYPDAAVLDARLGETQVWDVVNATNMDHPFHLHGYFFQVIERTGRPDPVVAWEDTVNIQRGERVRIAFRPDDRPGSWMFHCHILEHAAHGMMGELHVHP